MYVTERLHLAKIHLRQTETTFLYSNHQYITTVNLHPLLERQGTVIWK